MSNDSSFVTKTELNNAISDVLDGHTFRFLTQAEYDVLTDEEKNSSTIEYHITDTTPSGGSGEGLTSEQSSQLTAAYTHSQTPHVNADNIPTKVSDLTNDRGYVTESSMNEAINENKIYKITTAEYNKLSEAEKNGKLFVLTDYEEEQFSLSYHNNVLSLLKGNVIISQVTIAYSTNPGDPIATYGNIVLSKTSASIVKGESDAFTVKLDQAPTNEQVVTLTSDTTGVTLSTNSLTFTSENYNIEQEVTVNVSSDTSATSGIITSGTNGTNKTINIIITESEVTPTAFTVTNNLINVVNMNKRVTTVKQNESYNAMLRPTINYVIENVTITMGGIDVTSDVYSDASINIAAVTGNIVISATGKEANVTVSGGTLIHSYDLSQISEDGNYTDTVGGWNLSRSKKVSRNASLPSVARLDSFSIVFNGDFNNLYNHDIFSTGPAGGINITTPSIHYNTLGGRLVLTRDISYGGEIGKLYIKKYYKIDNNSPVGNTDINANIPRNTNTTIILISDADTNTTKIYVGGFLAYTLNQKTSLDGLCVDNRIDNASVKIYSGVVKVGV